ncbi:MAG: chaperone NapD [Gammaproteobacteria bacterium]|nr:chaperone NapD [Gammaproteobacteria bacterium]
MNICGILIHIKPENEQIMRSRLEEIDGVEIHAVSPEGQMVTTLEEIEEDTTGDKLFAIQRMEGVLSASMIYHHNEELGKERTEEDIPEAYLESLSEACGNSGKPCIK